MKKWLLRLETISDYFARIGGGMLLLCALSIVVEVLLRKFANYSIEGIDEYAGYALSIGVAVSLPYAVLKRANIRVDAVYNLLSEKSSAILDWLSALSMALFAGFLVYSSYDVFSSSLRFDATSNTPLSTPLWIPQAIWFFGFALFLITSLVISLLATFYLCKGKMVEIKELVGGKSIQDELEEEIQNKNRLI
jgi:TRAP-type mannitol/chloroaromatic compound transport system permease small subunit